MKKQLAAERTSFSPKECSCRILGLRFAPTQAGMLPHLWCSCTKSEPAGKPHPIVVTGVKCIPRSGDWERGSLYAIAQILSRIALKQIRWWIDRFAGDSGWRLALLRPLYQIFPGFGITSATGRSASPSRAAPAHPRGGRAGRRTGSGRLRSLSRSRSD